MTVAQLSEAAAARLQRAAFTYDPLDRMAGAAPPGFAELRRTRMLPVGADFDAAAGALLSWQVHARAGLRVAASSLAVEAGAVVVLRIGVGPLVVSAPCRVVYVVDEPDRQGFAYGTLPGHPESGQEEFVVERGADGRVEFSITAFSKPATALAKLGGPLTTWFQRRMTTRYLRGAVTLGGPAR